MHRRLRRNLEFLGGHSLRRKGDHFDLNAGNTRRRVRVKVSRGRVAASAEVWEEVEGADVFEDVVADDCRWRYLLLSKLRARAEPVDVLEYLTRALNKKSSDRRGTRIRNRICSSLGSAAQPSLRD